MAFTIRQAVQADSDPLQALMLEYICDFYGRPRPADEKLQALMGKLLEGQIGLQFVAEAEGRLLGFATLYFTWSTLRCQPVTIMNDLYVVKEARGTGAAEGLFRACESFTRDNGYAFMQWETAKENTRAQRFYAKMGGEKGDWLSYSI